MGWIRLPFFLSLFAVSTFLSHWHDPTCKFSFTKYAVCSAGKESVCNVEDLGSIPGLGRSPGEGKGYQLQYSGLENSMECIVHGVANGQTRLSNFHFTSLHFTSLCPVWLISSNQKKKKNPLTFKSKGKFASSKLKLLLGHFHPSIRVSFIFFSIIRVLSYQLVLIFSFCQRSCY